MYRVCLRWEFNKVVTEFDSYNKIKSDFLKRDNKLLRRIEKKISKRRRAIKNKLKKSYFIVEFAVPKCSGNKPRILDFIGRGVKKKKRNCQKNWKPVRRIT